MSDNLGVLGLEIRSGVHTGEIERRGDDIGGIGVNIVARIMGCAGGGEVWASSTVPGLSAGSGVVFSPPANTPSRASTACRTSTRSAAPPERARPDRLGRGWAARSPPSRTGFAVASTTVSGEGGIRTHGEFPHTRFPSVPIRPLSHPSGYCTTYVHTRRRRPGGLRHSSDTAESCCLPALTRFTG